MPSPSANSAGGRAVQLAVMPSRQSAEARLPARPPAPAGTRRRVLLPRLSRRPIGAVIVRDVQKRPLRLFLRTRAAIPFRQSPFAADLDDLPLRLPVPVQHAEHGVVEVL